ncbi:MAG: MASE1 domain-containing protein [Anaerolineaceae bacterium]
MSSNMDRSSSGKNADNTPQKRLVFSTEMAKLFRNPRLFIRPILIVVVYLSLFILLDLFSKQFEELSGVVAWYPPAGLIYALLLVFGLKYTPAVTLSLFISNIFVFHIPQPFYLILLWAIVVSLIYAGGVGLLRQIFRFDWQLEKLRDVILLIGAAVIISAILALMTILSSAKLGNLLQSDVARSIFIWWIGETVGVLTVAPFLLTHLSKWQESSTKKPSKTPRSHLSYRKRLSIIGQTLSIVLVFYFVFNVDILNISQPLYIFFLPLLWIALDHGLKGSILGIILINFGMMAAMKLLSPNQAPNGELQLLMIVICIIGLLVGKTITDQKETEDVLRTSENKYHTLFEQSAVGVALLETKTGRYREINQKYSDLVGYSKQELIDLTFRDITFPADIKENADNNALLFSGKIKQFSIEKRFIGKDGKIIWVLLTASPLWKPGEHPAEYLHIAVIQDISESKQFKETLQNDQIELRQLLDNAERSRLALLELAEDQQIANKKIKDLNETLEKRVATRTSQLQTSNKELEAFAYSVSHDLRAPLRAIDGYSRILEQDYAGALDKEGLRLLAIILENTHTMDHLITDLLALSRVGRSEINYLSINTKDLVQSVFNEMATPEVLNKFDVKVLDLPETFGDMTLIRQVWVNLISNAIKYTMPKEKGVIEISGLSENGVNTYTIKDNGVGFNPEYTAKLFGLFQRLHKAGDFEGTGVGLAIVQRIIQRHGGRVWAEGQLGAGASFSFTIPERQVTYE